MTYKEVYLKCKTLEEFKATVAKDVVTAQLLNPDRLTIIEKAINEVRKIHPEWVEE